MARACNSALVLAGSAAAVWILLLLPTGDAVSGRKGAKPGGAAMNVASVTPFVQRAPDRSIPSPTPSAPTAVPAPVAAPVSRSLRARAFEAEAPNDERSVTVSALISQFLVPRSEDAPADDGVLLDVDCRETLCRISARADAAGQAVLTKLAAYSSSIEMADEREDGVAQLTAYVALPAVPSNP